MNLRSKVMRSLASSVVLSLLFSHPLSLALAAAPGDSKSFRVMIDPGHGGTDAGAVHRSLKEADLTLKYALKLDQKLKEDALLTTELTRKADVSLSLPQRVKAAEAFEADLFMSLHLNSSSDSRAKGAQFFIENHLADEDASLREKNFFQEDLTSILMDLKRMSKKRLSLGYVRFLHENWFEAESFRKSQNTLAVRQAPFYVVRKSKMPSVLIEIGFLTNSLEAKNLERTEYQDKIVGFIHDSLTKYRQHLKKDSSELNSFK